MSNSDMGLSKADRPNSYIGRSVPRPNARKLLAGRGQFVDDLTFPRMLHAAFMRSPHAHARIRRVDITQAKTAPGVTAVYLGEDLAKVATPWVGVLSHLKGLRSAPQPALAIDVARWQGEPVAMVVAATRAQAEDAAALIEADYEPLPAALDAERALDKDETLIHEAFDSNLAWERIVDTGDADAAFNDPENTVIEREFIFARHTGVTLEPRATIVDWNSIDGLLTVHYSGQAPHMMQAVYARVLGLEEDRVRVIAKDVGGSYGIKIHTYGDEVATAAAAKILGRPVKFTADRLESFVSDIHARDHRVSGKLAVAADGSIQALEIDDLTGIGPYSVYPRTSAIESNQVLNLTGSPYVLPSYKARGRVVFQNKNVMCQYRAVGHPIAMAVADGLIEEAAAKIDMDPIEIRRRNLIGDDVYPYTTASGLRFDDLSQHKSLDVLVDKINYVQLREDQKKLRKKGIYRGIGFCSMVEVTNPSPMFYGVGGAPIAAQDGAVVRLEANGGLHVASSITEQGQGTEGILAQIAGDVMGMPMERVRVTTGDTDTVPYGGGTWASRGAGIGGEACLQAAKALKSQVLEVAAVILQSKADALDISNGAVVDASSGENRIGLKELAQLVYFRGNELPHDLKPEFAASRHFRVTDFPFVFTNTTLAAHVEVDTDTGFVKILKIWVVEDCGTIINPKLVDEQIRGGVVQGIGGVLYEECVYSDEGQLTNANLADYLVPMATEMPDIEIHHVVTPTKTSELGAKGAGEAGTGGTPAAVMNAINDALSPFDVRLSHQPLSPSRILKALGVE